MQTARILHLPLQPRLNVPLLDPSTLHRQATFYAFMQAVNGLLLRLLRRSNDFTHPSQRIVVVYRLLQYLQIVAGER